MASNLIVAHFFLAASFVLLFVYTQRRSADSAGYTARYVLLAFGLWPTTFFFRMAYSEPLFLLLCILSLYAMHRRWWLPICAAIVGAATASRPVGIGLLAPFLIYLKDRTVGWAPFFLRLTYLLPLACWGIVGFMGFQAIEYGDPLAFAKTQQYHRCRPMEASLADKLDSLLTLEPLWSPYQPSSICYWENRHETKTHPLFSLQAANPVYYLLTASAIGWGAWMGWLTRYEWTLGVVLLFIPYVTRSYEMCLTSFGRFAAAAFPVYLVLGRVLAGLPSPIAIPFLVLSGFLLGVYAALFAAGAPYMC